MNLTTQDQHELQLNPSAIPSPRFELKHTFTLSMGYSVMCASLSLALAELNSAFVSSRRAQLLEGEKILLVIADRRGDLNVYLDRLEYIDGVITHGRGKTLKREKIGRNFLLAYDESKKTLAVVSSDSVRVCLRYYCICVDDLTRIHSSYCISSYLTTRADFRHQEAQSTCIHGTTMPCLFAGRALRAGAKNCSLSIHKRRQGFSH